jgi:hypothetical protein
MHSISGAYALALSANGVGDLERLLTLDDEALSGLLRRCDMDAVDEIMLLEAVRDSRFLP